jgi:hypothetical protein
MRAGILWDRTGGYGRDGLKHHEGEGHRKLVASETCGSVSSRAEQLMDRGRSCQLLYWKPLVNCNAGNGGSEGHKSSPMLWMMTYHCMYLFRSCGRWAGADHMGVRHSLCASSS